MFRVLVCLFLALSPAFSSPEPASGEKPKLLRFNPLKITVIKDREIVAYIQLEIELEAEAKQDMDAFKNIAVKLHDAFLVDLQYAFSTLWQGYRPGGVDPDIDVIKSRLKRIVDVKAPNVVKNVYVRTLNTTRLLEGDAPTTPPTTQG